MAEKVTVRYVGPGSAVLAGKAIWHGEICETTRAQLAEAERYHPKGFQILGEEAASKKAASKKAASKEAKVPAPEPEVKISDAALKLAEEHGIDVATIEASGKDGSIIKRDVENAIAALSEATQAGEEGAASDPPPGESGDEESDK
jgi:pyruvate/2-oxoglutarate dehydrogenase complex dihydrolipoamide acyltransferase (E2) component